jgi:alpha-N-arabinofuranosidase
MSTLVRTLKMEEFVQRHSAIMDKYDPQKRVGLMVDEWGTWYDPEPGKDMGALYQQNTLRDAIVAGINLNIFNNHADRVQMANIAQMVNVLQAMVLTDKDRIAVTPTYHVFRMYRVHQGATSIPSTLSGPAYKFEKSTVPAVHVSTSRSKDGTLNVSLVNLDPSRAIEINTVVNGANVSSVTGEVLTSAKMNAMNTIDSPENIKPSRFTGFKLNGQQLQVSLPAKSVVVLALR